LTSSQKITNHFSSPPAPPSRPAPSAALGCKTSFIPNFNLKVTASKFSGYLDKALWPKIICGGVHKVTHLVHSPSDQLCCVSAGSRRFKNNGAELDRLAAVPIELIATQADACDHCTQFFLF
jgi:hypothetical protein